MEAVRSLGLVSTREAAELLECTVQHVRLLIRSGKIIGARVGRDWLVDASSIEAYSSSKYDDNQTRHLTVHEPQVECLFSEAELQPITNVASVPQRSPFRYPGGKTWLIPHARKWLHSLGGVELLVEPFAGGGGIGLTAAFEGYAKKALLIELDPDVAVVWRVMVEGQGLELARLIRHFDLTETTVREELGKNPKSEIHRAFHTILRNRVSRGGILAPGAGLVKTGEAGKGIASRWYPETLARRIEAIHDRRSSLQFEECDGMNVLRSYQHRPDVAYFIDPPYPVAGKRLYRCHELDHAQMFEVMGGLKGPFLATYDHNPIIEELALRFGFETRLVPMKSTHHTKKFELLIGQSLEWLD
jgi:DNA adenine methylase